MKRPFPLILAIVIVTSTLAQKPLSKKKTSSGIFSEYYPKIESGRLSTYSLYN